MKLIAVMTLAVSLLAPVAVPSAAAQESPQRYERRSGEMAIQDSVLDPFSSSRPIAPPPPLTGPRIPDSVDHQELDEEGVMDETERETYENYLVEQGLMDDPHDHLTLDRWDGSSGSEAEAEDDGGYDDPVEW